jgi:hypothetical protein
MSCNEGRLVWSLLSIADDDAQLGSWCRIQRLCIDRGLVVTC